MLRRFALAVAFVALALPLFAQLALAQQWGDLEATFVLKGKAPAPSKIAVTGADAPFCGKHNLVYEKLLVNKENGGIENVVVYIFPTPGQKVPVHPDYEKTAKETVEFVNEKCRYSPHVLTLRTGQKLVLTNKDPFGHNFKAEFFESANGAFNDQVAPGGKVEKAVPAAEASPVPFQCGSHPWMTGQLLVRNEPYFAVSDKDGKLVIKNLPVGDWTFKVWHETGFLTDVTVDGKPAKWARGSLKTTIKPGKNSLGKVEVDASTRKL
jgi:plastocyanin